MSGQRGGQEAAGGRRGFPERLLPTGGRRGCVGGGGRGPALDAGAAPQAGLTGRGEWVRRADTFLRVVLERSLTP